MTESTDQANDKLQNSDEMEHFGWIICLEASMKRIVFDRDFCGELTLLNSIETCLYSFRHDSPISADRNSLTLVLRFGADRTHVLCVWRP